MMRIAIPLMLIGALLLPAWTWAQPLEAPLVYKVYEGMHSQGEGRWPCTVGTRPEGDWKWPATDDAKAIYGAGQLGDLEYAFLFFRSKPELITPDRLVFDANGNRDLTDDPVLESSGGTQSREDLGASFPRMNLTIRVNGKDRPYACSLAAHCHNPGLFSRLFENLSGGSRKDAYVELMVDCFYESTVSLAGKERTIRFKDMNGNGHFGDAYRSSPDSVVPRSECDAFLLHSGPGVETERRMPLPDILGIGNAAMELRLDPDAGRLSLVPVAETACNAQVGPKFSFLVLELAGEEKKSLVLIEPVSGLAIPAGEYTLQFYEMEQDDGAGGAWLARAVGDGDRDPVVLSGPEAALPFGEPFTTRLETGAIERGLFSGAYADLRFRTIGGGGERVMFMMHRIPVVGSDEEWRYESPPPPRFKITLADGETVAEGAFRYG